MTSLKQSLLNYLGTLSGENPDLTQVSQTALPLFLRERYAIFAARLFGREYRLALETGEAEGASPGEYGKHAETLSSKLGRPVVLVIPRLPSYARNRMVQMRIPFIVPGSQTFMPNSLIDLRENFPQLPARRRGAFSPAAQCTVLYHLLHGSLADRPLKEIAQKVQYSPIMMTKVKNELETANICQAVRRERALVLNFKASGRALWEQVKPKLATPVKRARWVRWPQPKAPALLAGMSALSRRTMIADDRLPTYALPHAEFQDRFERGDFTGCPDSEHASARIEVWSYNPQLLGDEQIVDPLSLYLSLQASRDERVQQQLHQLIEKVKW